MSAYVPPGLRNKVVTKDISGESFPVLTSNNSINSSFATKAKEWETKRIQNEMKLKVDARIAEERIKNAQLKEEERQHLVSMVIPPRKKYEPKEVHFEEKVRPLADNQWTTVERKTRKKKEFDYSEPETTQTKEENTLNCWDQDDVGNSCWD
jgi:hypothetical protein